MAERVSEKSLQSIRRECGAFVRENEPLAPWTTWRIGGPARLFAEPRKLPELLSLFHILRNEEIPWLILGLGSNVLISDEGYGGVVIHPKGEFAALRIEGEHIVAGPAARLFDLTIFAARHSFSGMEALCGIPGSVGGGLCMNAGAFGGQISDGLKDVELLEPEGDLRILNREEVGFGYRAAPQLQKGIILQSRFSLEKREPRDIRTAMRQVWKKRRASQPLNMPSAGSVFKRPEGDFAGRLIEAAGAKGLCIGGAMVSTKHANFF
ncbi:MAG: UDP-N-acetylmuramate dehydrogenase, partial [Calditrichaeota bacterium]|nr:UDP-N-acetylmuramate dehydrogenase [Calditrichota bacterium]